MIAFSSAMMSCSSPAGFGATTGGFGVTLDGCGVARFAVADAPAAEPARDVVDAADAVAAGGAGVADAAGVVGAVGAAGEVDFGVVFTAAAAALAAAVVAAPGLVARATGLGMVVPAEPLAPGAGDGVLGCNPGIVGIVVLAGGGTTPGEPGAIDGVLMTGTGGELVVLGPCPGSVGDGARIAGGVSDFATCAPAADFDRPEGWGTAGEGGITTAL